MKVIFVPGSRNEELIREILRKKSELNQDNGEWEEYVCALVSSGEEENFDALYYACANGDEMLAEQAQYFHNLLLHDEKYYYAGRMGGFDAP